MLQESISFDSTKINSSIGSINKKDNSNKKIIQPLLLGKYSKNKQFGFSKPQNLNHDQLKLSDLKISHKSNLNQQQEQKLDRTSIMQDQELLQSCDQLQKQMQKEIDYIYQSEIDKNKQSNGTTNQNQAEIDELKYKIEIQDLQNTIFVLQNQEKENKKQYEVSIDQLKKELEQNIKELHEEKQIFIKNEQQKIQKKDTKIAQQEEQINNMKQQIDQIMEQVDIFEQQKIQQENNSHALINSEKKKHREQNQKFQQEIVYLADKFEEFRQASKLEVERIQKELKSEYENIVIGLQEKIHQKNQQTSSLEQQLNKNKNSHIINQENLQIQLKLKEEEIMKQSIEQELLEVQKETISSHSKIGFEMQQQLQQLQNELSLNEKERKRLQKEISNLQAKLSKFEKIIYGTKQK